MTNASKPVKATGRRNAPVNWTPRYPSHVVVDTIDGYTFASDADGNLFTKETAEKFANGRNEGMKPVYQSYRVFRLEGDKPAERFFSISGELLEYVVYDDDLEDVLEAFATEQEAAEFISTLPEHDWGRYRLDGPAQQ